MTQPLADLYVTLADQVLFMKGMFNAPDIDRFIDLNGTRLPSSVRRIEDVGEFAYHRASQLVADYDNSPSAEKKSSILEFLGDHAQVCIRGLRYVREELDALPYDIGTHHTLLNFQCV